MNIKRSFFILTILILWGCSLTSREYEGYVEGFNRYMSSAFAGRMVKMYVSRGQMVHKGDMLFQLDEQPQAYELKQAEHDLQQAQDTLSDLQKPERTPEIQAISSQIEQVEAEIELANLRVQRNQTLYNKKVLAKDTLDASITHLQHQKALKSQYEANLTLAKQGSREDKIKAQESQVKNLESKVREARWALEQKTVYAPLDGIIFDTYYGAGEYVPAQQPALAMLTQDDINILFFIPATALQELQPGKTVYFNCPGCTKDNPAIVSFISPEAEYLPPLIYSRENQDKLIFRIRAKMKNPLDFKPGQPVTVRIP